jgi:RNA polymerase sigma factor (sigma-70 family)
MNAKAGKTIAIVDDDIDVRDSLATLLSLNNFKTLKFSSGSDFLKEVSNQPIDATITDLMMPKMTGIELIENIRKQGFDFPVIVATGYGTVDTAVKAMRLGAVDILEKPFSEERLMQSLSECLDKVPTKSSFTESNVPRQEIISRFQRLSPRERHILTMVYQGKSSKEISEELSISINTVNNHRTQVKDKMRADSVSHLMSMIRSIEDVILASV